MKFKKLNGNLHAVISKAKEKALLRYPQKWLAGQSHEGRNSGTTVTEGKLSNQPETSANSTRLCTLFQSVPLLPP
jgi:hypothetical protein